MFAERESNLTFLRQTESLHKVGRRNLIRVHLALLLIENPQVKKFSSRNDEACCENL